MVEVFYLAIVRVDRGPQASQYPSHSAFSQFLLRGRLSEAFPIPSRLSRDVTPCGLYPLLRNHGLIPGLLIESLVLEY